jgi:SAM-dependent methyltransferase
LLRALRDLLESAGYEAGVVERATRLRRSLHPSEALGATVTAGPDDGPPLGTLIALFAIGMRVRRLDAGRALRPLALEQLAAAGLLELDGEYVESSVRAVALDGLLLLGDESDALSRDVVLPLYGQPTRLTSWLVPRRPLGSMLDLGTGSGVQALLASRHCERCVGVDVNPRAISYAGVNAGLNGVGNVQWQQGSWFAPVAGERFDLIVANPPYVVSPDREFTFRDSGSAPGELVGRLCGEAPGHLEDGGLAVVVCEWPHVDREDWDVVPRRWIEDARCDGIAVCLSTVDPLEYASTYNSPPFRRLTPAELESTITRWHAYHREMGIGAVSLGVVILRRRACGARWALSARSSLEVGADAARQITRMLAGNDLLAGGDDLLRCRVAVPDGLSVSQRFVRRDGGWVARVATVGVPGELGVTAEIDPDALPTIFRCDGDEPLDHLVRGEAERALVVSAIRELLARGLLEVR